MHTLMLAIAAAVAIAFMEAGPLRHAGHTARADAAAFAIAIAAAIDIWAAYRKRRGTSR